MKHVDQLLSAYVEGLLDTRDSSRVREHIAVCDYCRDALVRHERLSHDLRLAISQNPLPRREHIARWWMQLQPIRPTLKPLSAPHFRATSAVLPMMLAVFICFLPVAIGLIDKTHPASLMQSTDVFEPGVQVTVAPPTNPLYGTQEPTEARIVANVDTTSAAPNSADPKSSKVPVFPAPLAP